MKIRTAIITVTLTMLLVSILSLAGCNTWKGAGKDIEKAGEGMQGD